MSQVTKTFTEHPQNSITLMNGAVLECFPKESHQGDFVPDQMKLDTTGVYLSIGNKPCKPQPNTTEEKERQKKLFTDNAFYLLAHQERIMRDSRMFLAPVAVQNGLAYIGTSGFNAPTLDIESPTHKNTPYCCVLRYKHPEIRNVPASVPTNRTGCGKRRTRWGIPATAAGK